jgi:GNAT superfamily N-acetyltransferase
LHGLSTEIEIRPYEESDLEAIVEFSLRAWQPVFESLRHVRGNAIFVRLHEPEWTAVQAEAVRSSCTSDERDVFVAVADGLPVGFAAVALNAFHERMGVVDIIAVDPGYQRRGIARQLMERASEHMRSQEWTSPPSEPAATRDTARRVRCTSRSATRRCRASGTSGCSTDAHGGDRRRLREHPLA